MNFGKLIFLAVVAVVGFFIAYRIVLALLGWVLHSLFVIAIPLALVAGLVYIVYKMTDKKAIGSNNRDILP